ncbi:hypothetical protein FNW02_19550 [Komarekiella sp. 'clone 1']|uniref:Uncharacterized protein n=1 Tax=Komarekiella delphini-convector SJRDD-AB1 TaxID=2593771 RepID=A0AA40SZJ3_9NOST|nr:hypothetical protein [Komarekiella delphini-convector]MBD6617960.1 hypothetical protein [Komarekiella delphini-convector SJRDD-AB1]
MMVLACQVDDDWYCHQLDTSTWVSYCPNLRASWTSDILIYALLFGIEQARRVNVNQIDLISRTVPELSKYLCSPEDRYFGILKAIATKLSRNPLYVYIKVADKLRWKL